MLSSFSYASIFLCIYFLMHIFSYAHISFVKFLSAIDRIILDTLEAAGYSRHDQKNNFPGICSSNI